MGAPFPSSPNTLAGEVTPWHNACRSAVVPSTLVITVLGAYALDGKSRANMGTRKITSPSSHGIRALATRVEARRYTAENWRRSPAVPSGCSSGETASPRATAAGESGRGRPAPGTPARAPTGADGLMVAGPGCAGAATGRSSGRRNGGRRHERPDGVAARAGNGRRGRDRVEHAAGDRVARIGRANGDECGMGMLTAELFALRRC